MTWIQERTTELYDDINELLPKEYFTVERISGLIKICARQSGRIVVNLLIEAQSSRPDEFTISGRNYPKSTGKIHMVFPRTIYRKENFKEQKAKLLDDIRQIVFQEYFE